MTIVYASKKNQAAAIAYVAELREAGQKAVYVSTRHFAGEFLPAERVFVDDTDGPVAALYHSQGVDVEPIPTVKVKDPAKPGDYVVKNEADVTPADEPFEEGWRVEQNGQWFTLYGPDGEKVGKAARSEAEAWAQKPE